MLREALAGFGIFIGYFVILGSLLLIVRALFKPPRELFRKMLHLVCCTSVFVLLYAFDTWYLAMSAALAFALLVYPVIVFAERFPPIMDILVQRRGGEIRSSLMIVFTMMAGLIVVFWGALGEQWKYIIIVAVMAWGFGDAAAALVGKAWGRHPIRHRWVEGAKTREGTIAMYAISAATILLSLLAYAPVPWYLCLVAALLVAPICAVVELISHRGIDTITVPVATAIPVLALMLLFSFMGV